MPTTRRKSRQQALATLPLEPNLLVHVFSALQMHHGPAALETASGVCRCWRTRVEDSSKIDDDPENFIGELRSGDKPYRFDRPHDAIFLPNGDVCVADCDNFRLQIVTRDGIHVRDVRLSGGTSCPTGVAYSGDYFYVVEHGAHQVSKLRRSSSSGHRHATAGTWGGGDGELRHPWGIAVSERRVYVSDAGNDRICAFDGEKLTFLFSFGAAGKKFGELREPRGLAHYENELYVADHRNHRIQVFSTADADNGRCEPVRLIGGGRSTIAGRFNGPSGVCVANGRLHVAEVGGQRLQVLTLDGLPLQCLPAYAPISGVAADEENICCTALEGDHALTLWRVMPERHELLS